MGTLHTSETPTEGAAVSSTTTCVRHSSAADRVAHDDIFGMARYLADAVGDGEISEEAGEIALWEWAAPDRDVLERAARHLRPDSEAERLVIGAYHHAA